MDSPFRFTAVWAISLVAAWLPLASATNLHAAPPPEVRTPTEKDAEYPPHEPGDEMRINKTQELRKPGVYDFKYKVLRWTGKGNCNQRENQPPMFEIHGKNIVLKNAFILNAPDGIHVYGKNVKLENIYFMKVCEDAITATGAVDLDITGCYFYDAKDKVIQLNSGRDIEIYGNVFQRFGCAIRVKTDAQGVQIRNNLFLNGKKAVFANGKGARVDYLGENLASHVGNFAWAEEDARIQLASGNRLRKVGTPIKTKDGGKVRED